MHPFIQLQNHSVSLMRTVRILGQKIPKLSLLMELIKETETMAWFPMASLLK